MTHSTHGISDEPTGVTSLKDLSADLLAQARERHSRRAAKAIVAGALLPATALALGEQAHPCCLIVKEKRFSPPGGREESSCRANGEAFSLSALVVGSSLVS
jgi:hypothetical protein